MKKSDSITAIAPAMAEFQAEVKDPVKGAKNPYFDSQYVDLGSLLDATRPALTKHGLSIMQFPTVNERAVSITTLVMHKSGEWIESDPFTLTAVKPDPQSIGSAVTYGRRYALSSILGIAWDADDDGNIASNRNEQDKGVQKTAQKGNIRPVNKKTVQANVEQKKAKVTENKQVESPQTVKDYYDLTVEWAKNNRAVTFIGPLLRQKFNKGRFEELTLVEAKAFYANLETLVADAKKADDAALMDGVG